MKAVEEAFRLLGEKKAVNRPRQRIRAGKLVLHVMPAGSEVLVADLLVSFCAQWIFIAGSPNR